jgi:hypothetical protein
MKLCQVCPASVPNHRKYCSHACHSKDQRKTVNLDLARSLALQGVKAGELARAIGCSVPTARTLLRKHGLHHLWTQNRYLKCREVA